MIISSSFLVAIAVAQPTGPFAPRSWWRFEDAAHLGADEMGRHDLTPASTMDPETVASPSQRTTGGVVGGYIDFSGGDQNLSWTANASYLPMQCSHNPAAGGLCPKDDPMLCANGHCPRGLTIELLVRLGRDALKAGNLTLLESQGNAGRYGGSWTWVDLSRHGLSFRSSHAHATPKPTTVRYETFLPVRDAVHFIALFVLCPCVRAVAWWAGVASWWAL